MITNIDELLNKANNLPQNFHVAVKTAKLLDNLNVDIHELSRTISSDQALVTQLLKLCNSAQYGFSKKIASVNDAIARLGFKTLKSIVFAIVTKGSFNRKIEGYDLQKGELWKNSISCAVYAKYLAELTGYKDPELAFTVGLLRDIGKLIIHQYVKEKSNQIISMVDSEKITFLEAEERVLGYNHSQIGAKIASKWNFPKVIEEAIEFHHGPENARGKCEDFKLINIVHVADSMTMILGVGIGSDGMMNSLDIKSLETLGININSANIESLISDLVDLNSQIDSLSSNIG